ncbi:hypothetical protein GCM10022252_01930 [Streptosporangium oxazolinicum]|uniref:Gram-positive cocci surface proteins LPxTG domain-containing protein n=1 Tax=Streptosporangium oxazolinicum TaxID=909287 RepID=A0ABP8A913_9ACTN
MLKSKTRLRVAVKTAVIAAAGAVIFGAFPALASIYASPNPVAYSCTVPGAVTPSATYTFNMDLTGPTAAVTNSPVVATWKVAPTGSVVAPTAIPAALSLILDADVQIDATPAGVLAVPSELRPVAATAPAAAMTSGQPITLPTLMVTVTPSATGVVAFKPDSFTLLFGPAAGATSADVEVLVCNLLADTQASAQASTAALRVTVGTGTPSQSTSPSPTPTTPTPTPTVTTPRPTPTLTVTRTRTSDPDPDPNEQIDETPKGAASTGGGGDSGPDARMIMLSGVLMVGIAGIGGLVLRRRTAGRG